MSAARERFAAFYEALEPGELFTLEWRPTATSPKVSLLLGRSVWPGRPAHKVLLNPLIEWQWGSMCDVSWEVVA